MKLNVQITATYLHLIGYKLHLLYFNSIFKELHQMESIEVRSCRVLGSSMDACATQDNTQ